MNQEKTYIIAEAGVNHNGSLDLACNLIDIAADAGADAVKFQTFKANNLVSKGAPKADYQLSVTDKTESQYEMIRKLELDEPAHLKLIEHCQNKGIQFLSTPFDIESADLLAGSFDLPCIKIPSGEITNGPLLLHIAQTAKPVILSTGMSTLDEVRQALGVLAYGYTEKNKEPSLERFQKAYQSSEGQKALHAKVSLLHCTTEYPAPFSEVNLRAMDTLKEAFGLPVGLSDHTPGGAVSIAAVARGAAIIEKHFTLDRNLPGPDHRASLEPEELKGMVRSIRDVEMALGDGVKKPSISEERNLQVARKSLFAKKTIEAGELFSEENLGIKRPGSGLSPMHYWLLLGQEARRNYSVDEQIDQ